MIDYEKYAKIRDSKGMKDSDVARIGGFNQSVLSDWKRNVSIPKMDKMQKIADALEMDYFEFVGPVGKFSSLNPNKPLPHLNGMMPGEISDFDKKLLDLYHNATAETQRNVLLLLEIPKKKV